MNSKPVPKETSNLQEQLVQLLQETLGSKVEWVDCTIRKRDQDDLVLLVRLRHPSMKVVIKLAGPNVAYAYPFDRTAMLHGLVRAHTTIPMPQVLAFDVSCQRWPWCYLIKQHVPGEEWAVVREQMDAQDLTDAYQQMGEAVAQLHTIHFPAFGELAADGSVERSLPYVTALALRAQRFIRSISSCDIFLSVLDEHAHLFSDVGEPSLCHDDLHRHNILFQRQQGRWRLATILDFDKAWAGYYETDLARLEIWTEMTSQEFWSAYKAIHPVDPLYEQRRLIYQLLWCLEYARSTTKHLADTQRVCVEMGIPPMERFD